MAYLSNNLSVLPYANGFTLWHYKTPDRIGDIMKPGYFDTEIRLVVGDRIIVNANTDADSSGELEFGDIAVCRSAAGEVVVRLLKSA